MQKPNYVLENNRTPATHFIEIVAMSGGKTKSFGLSGIGYLASDLRATASTHWKTIAIFKIHPKCKN